MRPTASTTCSRARAQLIAQGFDKEQIKKLPSYIVAHTIEEIARDTVDESTLRQGEDNLNTANRLIQVTEHYVRMDYEGNDEPRLYRITTGGEEVRGALPATASPTWWNGIDPVRRHDAGHRHPPVFRPLHRRPGKDIQGSRPRSCAARSTTSTWHTIRGWRCRRRMPPKRRLTICWSAAPAASCAPSSPAASIGRRCRRSPATVFPALQYFDATREWRTGVNRQGQGVDANALQNQSPPPPTRCTTPRRAA